MNGHANKQAAGDSFSTWRPRFSSIAIHVKLLVTWTWQYNRWFPRSSYHSISSTYSFICRPRKGQRPNQRPQIHTQSQPTTRINKIIRRMDSEPVRGCSYKSHSFSPSLAQGKGKGRVHPRTSNEDPHGEVRYWLRPHPYRFTPGNNPVTIA